MDVQVNAQDTAAVQEQVKQGTTTSSAQNTPAPPEFNAPATRNYLQFLNLQQDNLTEDLQKSMRFLQNSLNQYMQDPNAAKASADAAKASGENSGTATYTKLSTQVINRDTKLQEKVAQNLSTSHKLVRSRDAANSLEQSMNNLPDSLKEGTQAGKNLSKFILQNLVTLTNSQSMGAGLERDLAQRQVFVPQKELSSRTIAATNEALSSSIAYVEANNKDNLKNIPAEEQKVAPGSTSAQAMTRYLRQALNEFPDDSTYLDIFKQNRGHAAKEPYEDKISEQISNRVHNLIEKAAQTARRANLIPGQEKVQLSQQQPGALQAGEELPGGEAAKAKPGDPNQNVSARELSLSELSARAAKLQQQFRQERQKLVQEGKLPDPAAMPKTPGAAGQPGTGAAAPAGAVIPDAELAAQQPGAAAPAPGTTGAAPAVPLQDAGILAGLSAAEAAKVQINYNAMLNNLYGRIDNAPTMTVNATGYEAQVLQAQQPGQAQQGTMPGAQGQAQPGAEAPAQPGQQAAQATQAQQPGQPAAQPGVAQPAPQAAQAPQPQQAAQMQPLAQEMAGTVPGADAQQGTAAAQAQQAAQPNLQNMVNTATNAMQNAGAVPNTAFNENTWQNLYGNLRANREGQAGAPGVQGAAGVGGAAPVQAASGAESAGPQLTQQGAPNAPADEAQPMGAFEQAVRHSAAETPAPAPAQEAEAPKETGFLRKIFNMFSGGKKGVPGEVTQQEKAASAPPPAAPAPAPASDQTQAAQRAAAAPGQLPPAASQNPLDALMTRLKTQAMNINSSPEVKETAQKFIRALENPVADLTTVNQWLNFITGPMNPNSPQALALHQWAFLLLVIRFRQLGKSAQEFLEKSGKIDLKGLKFDQLMSKMTPDEQKISKSLLDDTMSQIERLQKMQENNVQVLPRYVPLPPNYDGGREGGFTIEEEKEGKERVWHLTFFFDIQTLGPIEIKASAKIPELQLSVVAETVEGLQKVQELMPQLIGKLQEFGITTRSSSSRLGVINPPTSQAAQAPERTRRDDGSTLSIDI